MSEKRDAVLSLFHAGKSYVDIAATPGLQVSAAYARVIVSRARQGVDIPCRKKSRVITLKERATILRLAKQKMGPKAIAIMIGRSRGTISNYMRRLRRQGKL